MMNINIRGVDGDLWRRLRAVAVLRGVSLGALLNQILLEWLDRQAASSSAAPH
jgi:hypothetical protein